MKREKNAHQQHKRILSQEMKHEIENENSIITFLNTFHNNSRRIIENYVLHPTINIKKEEEKMYNDDNYY